jgi:hypothetical protein
MFSLPKAASLLASVCLVLAITSFAENAAEKNPSGIKVEPAAPTTGAPKSCQEVKAGIEEKLKAKGVKAFTLEVLAKADVKTEKVVGTCEAGAKKIVYKK